MHTATDASSMIMVRNEIHQSAYSNDILSVKLKPSILRTYFAQIFMIVVILFFSSCHIFKGLYVGFIDIFSQLMTILLGIWLASFLSYFFKSEIQRHIRVTLEYNHEF